MPSVIEFLGYERSICGDGLAGAIKATRRSLGLTQAAFGKLVGVSRETINLGKGANESRSVPHLGA